MALLTAGWVASPAYSFQFSTVWRDHQQVAGQQEWKLQDFASFKKKPFREKNPESGQAVAGKGILLRDLMEKALTSLSPEQAAAVDLIILRGRDGKLAYMPRVFAANYPTMVGIDEATSRLSSVVPLDSQPKIRKERLPVERYFIADLAGLEFTTYESTFGTYFLKKRTDPKSIRGERIVVQNCMSCHAAAPAAGQPAQTPQHTAGALAARFLAGATAETANKPHPSVLGYSAPGEDERKAISSYLNARNLEASSK